MKNCGTVVNLSPVIIIISWKPRNRIFECKLNNIHNVLLLENTLVWKKILWRINFVLIKFSLNALLFEKLRNECKSPSFLYKATCIVSDHCTTKMRCSLFTFVACNCRGLRFIRMVQSLSLPTAIPPRNISVLSLATRVHTASTVVTSSPPLIIRLLKCLQCISIVRRC